MREPLVSVCIPTRDRAHWLGDALESVFRQTLQDFEIVVFDDASADDTRDVVARWADPRLRYLHRLKPAGVARNRNSCLAAARGRYVAWLDSDDRYLPQMLEVQTAALERHPGAALVHGGFEVIGETGRRLPDWPQAFSRDVVEPGPEAFAELALRNYVTAPTVLVRRAVYRRVGAYRTSLPSGEDWEMWLRIALDGDLAYTAAPVAQYRWHPGSLARTAEASGSRLARELAVLSGVFARHRARIPHAGTVEARARAALVARAVHCATDGLTRGLRRRALADLSVAARARPRLARSGAFWRLLAAGATGDEFRWHVASRKLHGELAAELAGSRLAARLLRVARPAPEWDATQRAIARTVRAIVPAAAGIAVVDKWDPTVLHLSRRRGWHFPDRRTLPDGYPADCAAAVRHLEELRHRGAVYLVLPASAFWWLDHYPGLRRYLEAPGDPVHADDRCRIYRLPDREAA